MRHGPSLLLLAPRLCQWRSEFHFSYNHGTSRTTPLFRSSLMLASSSCLSPDDGCGETGGGKGTTRGADLGQMVIENNALFGRLPKCGRSYLMERGGWQYTNEAYNKERDSWSKCEGDEEYGLPPLDPLAFIWPNKSGPQFETNTRQPAWIRPYPTTVTDTLDDKLLLAKLMESTNCMPDHVFPSEEFKNLLSPSISDDPEDQLYFVKHRHGAQGKSVYVRNRQQLEQWMSSSRNPHDFVIQKEVPPALDAKGRKFILRSHVLFFHRHSSQTSANFRCFLHQHVLCLPHACPYERKTATEMGSKAMHISQAGRNHPKPLLLDELQEGHAAKHVFSQVLESCRVTMDRFCEAESPSLQAIHEKVTCFALVGMDHLVDGTTGTVRLCEVNSHPALGWGSMKQVDYQIYKELITDMLAILVFGDDHSSTRFIKVS